MIVGNSARKKLKETADARMASEPSIIPFQKNIETS